MAQPSPSNRIVLVDVRAWNLAQRVVANESGQAGAFASAQLDDAAADAAWHDLVASGLALRSGELDPDWQQVLASTLTAEIAFRVVSTYRDLAYLADVTINEGVVTCLLRRLRVTPATDGALEPVGADPVLEFAVTPGNDPWPLVRRVLPPFDEFRAAPAATPEAGIRDVVLGDDIRQRVRNLLTSEPMATAGKTLTSLPGLPPAVRDVVRAKATVMSLLLVHPAGTPKGSMGMSMGYWALGEGGLYRLRLRSGDAVIGHVQAGDLGYHVTWQTLGALDVVRAARRAGFGEGSA